MIQRLRLRNAFVALGVLSAPTAAMAYDWVAEVSVSTIEVTYMPNAIVFEVTANAGACAAGTMLTWNAKGATEAAKAANAQAVLSGLLTARASNRQVRIYGKNAGCTIDYLHLL